jgi:hypothetical protein
MSHHAFEFIVVDYVADDRFRVIGRNGDEDVKIGDVFDVMYRYKRANSPEERGADPVREPGERDIHVRVVGIYALSRDLQHLGVGMTGALTVEGEGIEDIAPGWVLGRRESLEGAGRVNGQPTRA